MSVRERAAIEGWELNNPDPDYFKIEVVDVFGPCKDCELYLTNRCHTPEDSVRRLVPKRGRVERCARGEDADGCPVSYFALLEEGSVRFLKLTEPGHHWATACLVPKESVPRSCEVWLKRVA